MANSIKKEDKKLLLKVDSEMKERSLAKFKAYVQSNVNFIFTKKCWPTSVRGKIDEIFSTYRGLVGLGIAHPITFVEMSKILDTVAEEVCNFRAAGLQEEGRKALNNYFQDVFGIDIPMVEMKAGEDNK